MKEEYILVLFELLPGYSEAVKKATVAHLSHGLTQISAANKYNTLQPSVARATKSIRRVDKLVTKAAVIKLM